jgi:hypothetical protein
MGECDEWVAVRRIFVALDSVGRQSHGNTQLELQSQLPMDKID